jgi:hypothetical protein
LVYRFPWADGVRAAVVGVDGYEFSLPKGLEDSIARGFVDVGQEDLVVA